MPSTTEPCRALITKWFGSIDDSAVLAFLATHGFTEEKGNIIPPVPAHSINHEEWVCIIFLIEEWDYDFSHPPIYPLDSWDLTQ